jgi:hypothetical protein
VARLSVRRVPPLYSQGEIRPPVLLQHDDPSHEADQIITDMCDYHLSIAVDHQATSLVRMTHRTVEIGMGSWLQRFECTPDTPMPPDARVHISFVAKPRPVNAFTTRTLKDIVIFSGSFTLSAEYKAHHLGHPSGGLGRMVQIDEKSFMFVFDSGEVTYQCNM